MQPPTPSLPGLPAEIIESILNRLPLVDICSLRLTNRTLSSKTTQDHFKSYFKTKHVDLTESALRAFNAVTKDPGSLACSVENLVLVGVVYNTLLLERVLEKKSKRVVERMGMMFTASEAKCSEEELDAAARDLEILTRRKREQDELFERGGAALLLGRALENVRMNGKKGMLKKLNLDVVIYREDAEKRLSAEQGGSWKLIWKEAARTLETTLYALSQSRLPLEEMDVFSEVPRCAVARDDVSRAVPGQEGDEEEIVEGLRTSFESLKAFSISISHRNIDEREEDRERMEDGADPMTTFLQAREAATPRDIEVLRAEAADEQNFEGLARLLQLCEKSVERLDLHQCRLQRSSLHQRDMCDERLLQRILEIAKLERLEGARLRGMFVKADDLRKFLGQSKILRQVVLQEMHVTEGDWKGILQDLTAEKGSTGRADVDCILLDDLFERGRLLYFAGEEDDVPKCPTLCRTRGKNAFIRRGVEDVRREMKYHFATERMVGSPQAAAWREGRTAVYGPP
ncbi:hypothetical protein CKM354_000434800 [Cercospora kikuchii]|uniref:F-box domain-containing protein n=1 Tax=Cercospora kikuchii TaxID=84275 RepID=A0A9P3CFR2_9PEZI|nr:uncharacterized protein CKM354_000434800 [Cercospora kikuchii]GIZ41031.1 hypothetical protein CKM354_000434800 [Cercospora kikuchii]